MGARLDNKLNGGELDPLIAERLDLEKRYSSCRLGQNVIFLPQGGFSNRPGLAMKARLKRRLQPVPVTSSQVTAPVGGRPEALFDAGADEFKTGPINSTRTNILQIDFTIPQPVTFFDVLGYSGSVSGKAADELLIPAGLGLEYSADGTNWSGFGHRFNITNAPRSRRFAALDRTEVTARYWRLFIDRETDADVLSSLQIKSLEVFAEGDELSDVMLAIISRSNDDTYVLPVTDHSIEVFRDGNWMSSLPVNIDSDMLGQTTSTRSLSTLLLFHTRQAPRRIRYQGADHEWNSDIVEFTNIPELSTASSLDGKSGPMMSDENGWPGCGAFWQSRLFVGGMPAAPGTVLTSRIGHFFDFTTKFDNEVTRDAGMENTMNSDEQEVIRRIFAGRHLQIFTDVGEWYISNRSIDATQPLNLVIATRNGIAPAPRPVFVEGGTLYASAGGGVIRDFLYSDTEQSYRSESATLWGAHLIKNVCSMAHRRAAGSDEGELILIVMDDGTAVTMTMMRGQKVQSIARFVTAGKIRSVAVDQRRQIYVVVEREVNGRRDLWFEHLDTSRLLDFSVKYHIDDSQGHIIAYDDHTLITGLDHLNGRNVWAIVDGSPEGPFGITDGQLILRQTDVTEVEIGELPDMRLQTQPIRDRLPDGTELKKKKRIWRLHCALLNTGALNVRVCDGPWRTVPVDRHDKMRMDVPLMQRLFSGTVKVENLRGFYEAPWVEVHRPLPCPVTVTSLAMEVA